MIQEFSIEANKMRVEDLLNQAFGDDAINVFNALKISGYFEKPASRNHHLNVLGGLCQHSLNVLDIMNRNNAAYKLGITKRELIISALFHDIGKISLLPNSLCHCEKSVIEAQSVLMISGLSGLPYRIIEAIRYHEGLWSKCEFNIVGEVFDNNKLAALLHIADMEASQLWEETK